jgi:DNA-binding CsgD family transcriptional regulator
MDESSRLPGSDGLEPNQFYREVFGVMIPNVTDREVEICILIAKGYPNAKICKELTLDVCNLDNHRWHVRKKLGLSRYEHLQPALLNLLSKYRASKNHE